jgi:hypothetical protein
MKPFSTYQFLEGFPMTDRDKVEVGSKYWNEGKFKNFVAPFLPYDCSEQTFIDMGCNAGVFLKLAEDMGFSKVIGVDSDRDAVKRGTEWRDSHGGKYQFVEEKMQKVIDQLPLADYTVLANAHYYFTINDWLDYMDKMQFKTRYCIIVTAEKHHTNRCWTSPGLEEIRGYFKLWEEEGFIDVFPQDGSPSYRKLWAFCFKSPHLDRVPVDLLDSGNHVQDGFYKEIDEGKDYKETRYYRIMKPYRKNWSEDKLNRWFEERIKVYESIKKNGQTQPIIVDSKNLILDGNHRYSMLKSLGYKTIFVRYV